MNISKRMYCSESIKDRKRRTYIKKIRNNESILGVYAIVIIEEATNLMEVVSTSELYRLNNKCSVTVIGFVKNRDEAKLLIEDIISDCYQNNALDKGNLIKEFQ